MVDATPEKLRTWADEMTCSVSEDENYLTTLRAKHKPAEILALMELRLETQRQIRDYLTELAAVPAPPAPSSTYRKGWDD